MIPFPNVEMKTTQAMAVPKTTATGKVGPAAFCSNSIAKLTFSDTLMFPIGRSNLWLGRDIRSTNRSRRFC